VVESQLRPKSVKLNVGVSVSDVSFAAHYLELDAHTSICQCKGGLVGKIDRNPLPRSVTARNPPSFDTHLEGMDRYVMF
jgi:hypothetical protein